MASLQLSCPYCGSVLSFTQEVRAGAAIQCMICNRSINVAAQVPARRAKPASNRLPAASASPRILGGLALGVVLLLMLGGLALLFWHSVFAERPSVARDASVAKGPDIPANPGNAVPIVPKRDKIEPAPPDSKDAAAPPRKNKESAKNGDEVDIADLKKPDKPPPVVVQPEPTKPDPEIKLPTPPTIETTVPAPAGPPGVDAARVNAAIATGLRYLNQRQQPDGSWGGDRTMAYTALAGLTLLECKVPADDPSVKRAANFVRGSLVSTNVNATYDLSVAILFLDRLGDPKDRPLIKAMALRLLSGQDAWGGWNYTCERVGDADLQNMHAFLKAQRPRALPPAPKLLAELPGDPSGNSPLTGPLRWNRWGSQFKFSVGDNSNTQFAILALWVARRHDISAELPLVCSYQRFVCIQNPDGGWGYNVMSNSTSTMTCAGLLGLALGRGAVPAAGKDKLEDPAIQKGLEGLGKLIGTPSQDAAARPPMQNLYFLWSVERVAMLYDLKTIGGKDWYGWGAQILLAHQQADGHWSSTPYTGNNDHVDTCFALLFLNRSNLVSDLTERLRLHMVIRDPAAPK